MNSCLVCRSSQIEDVLDLGQQPVSSHFTRSPNQPVVEHSLSLSVCLSCGVVQLAKPFPFQDLVPPYEWITYREPESHLDAVVATIMNLPGLNSAGTAAGLSFKDTTTLNRLASHGFSQTWCVDPQKDLGAENPNANIESLPGLLSRQTAAHIADRRGPVDLLIARHILEHAGSPWRFMEALAEMIVPGGILVIEVPDCRANLERQDYTMIWEEHTLYFTPETVSQVLAHAGFVPICLEVHPFAFEDVILLYARKENPGKTAAKHVEPAAIERNVVLAREYGTAFPMWTKRYTATLEGLAKGGKQLAAYGAGHLTCAFINFHKVADHFAFIVDDTSHKQGLYLPKSGLPIVPNERLKPDAVAACLFGLAPEIEDKIIANNPLYAGSGAGFYSMFADSARSLRGITV